MNKLIKKLIAEARSFAPRPSSSRSSSRSRSDHVLEIRGLQRFQLDEMHKATNGFDESKVIGKGGSGKVYKGIINILHGSTDMVVAVKRFNQDQLTKGLSMFQTEIKMLSEIQHCHVVSLLGYCHDSSVSEMILVYEYMPHGTLADHLYRNINANSRFLPWVLRLKICIGAARGLEYLHTGLSDKIAHRDIKSSNILLDKDFTAKISDLGLSKNVSKDEPCSDVLTEHVRGTHGYIDPHYRKSRKFSRKTDVYAFGVVLLEVLTGTRSGGGGVIPDDTEEIADWMRRHMAQKTLYKICSDRRVRADISPKSLEIFANIASKSLRWDPKKRPTMSQVVADLERALSCQEGTNPYSSSIVDYESKSKKFSDADATSCRGDLDAAETFTISGYDVNAPNDEEHTPLLSAAREGHGKLCKPSISKRATCQVKNARHETVLELSQRKGNGNATEQVSLDDHARGLVLSGAHIKKHRKEGKGSPHNKTLKMVEGDGILSWGKSSRRNVVCKRADVGASSSFRWNRGKKPDVDEPGLFHVVTNKGREVHFVCEGGVQMARLWVRGIKLVTREAFDF